MEKDVKYCVILQYMSIDIDREEHDVGRYSLTQMLDSPMKFGDAVHQVWATIRPTTSTGVTPGSIAASYMTKQLKADVEAPLETKALVVEHLWIARGASGSQFA